MNVTVNLTLNELTLIEAGLHVLKATLENNWDKVSAKDKEKVVFNLDAIDRLLGVIK